jgi:hypothetical protein
MMYRFFTLYVLDIVRLSFLSYKDQIHFSQQLNRVDFPTTKGGELFIGSGNKTSSWTEMISPHYIILYPRGAECVRENRTRYN